MSLLIDTKKKRRNQGHEKLLLRYSQQSSKGINTYCLAVDYSTSNHYKLVIVGKQAEQEGYKFYAFSSERSGVWHEFQLGINLGNSFSYLVVSSKPVYVNDSLHWLRDDGRVLAFDTKRDQATILDLPEFINYHDPIWYKSYTGFTWLGVAQGLLTLVCVFKKSIIIATYDYVSNNWRVSHTLDNFITGVDGYNYGFPI
nr:uncharacterized protein LOC117280301 [Nicotiana tomentosiformis]